MSRDRCGLAGLSRQPAACAVRRRRCRLCRRRGSQAAADSTDFDVESELHGCADSSGSSAGRYRTTASGARDLRRWDAGGSRGQFEPEPDSARYLARNRNEDCRRRSRSAGLWQSTARRLPQRCLQTLLDGTGTNILLQETPSHAPEQLMLTPRPEALRHLRQARPAMTRPRPSRSFRSRRRAAGPRLERASSGQALRDGNDSANAPTSRPQLHRACRSRRTMSSAIRTTSRRRPRPLPVTNSVPVNTLPTPSTAPPVSGIVDAPNPPPAGSTTAGFTNQTPPNSNPNTATARDGEQTNQTSPNGVKTPQQIYEELKQLSSRRSKSEGEIRRGLQRRSRHDFRLCFTWNRCTASRRAENLRALGRLTSG